MPVHPLAGRRATPEMLIDVVKVERAYWENRPDFDNPNQRVVFGTSGHRGSSIDSTFTEAHILAVTQAICDWRRHHGIGGPLLMGKDTHVLSASTQRTALEVLAANGVETVIARNDGVTPVPAMSRAVLIHNRHRSDRLADALIATPSHNPPADGGIKYNPPNGGPAPTEVTSWIQDRANMLLHAGNRDVCRLSYGAALRAETTRETDFIAPYVEDLKLAIDMDAIRGAGLRLGADPLGGTALSCWERINATYGLDIDVVNKKIDPTFSFMAVDHDGQIRMDCSSRYAMANLVRLKDCFRLAFGNDPDSDRHGIVTPSAGLMEPNRYLAVSIRYLLTHRPGWPLGAAVGKTVVSSALIDQVVHSLGRNLYEVPVGFKWFAQGLFDGTLCFGGEESAGASFLQKDGTVWTTDKDGLVMDLLAAEMTARTGKDPSQRYGELISAFGTPYYARIDMPATPHQKAVLEKLSLDAENVGVTELAGQAVTAILTHAPANNAPLGGLKVVAANGWFAVRPSGTEDLYKIYAESFRSQVHLDAIVSAAQQLVSRALGPTR